MARTLLAKNISKDELLQSYKIVFAHIFTVGDTFIPQPVADTVLKTLLIGEAHAMRLTEENIHLIIAEDVEDHHGHRP